MKIDKKDFLRARVHAHITPGEALKILRELQGLTQLELAQKTGINQSNISALESNARQMGRGSAVVLARALKVHPAVILFPDFDIEEAA
ncbi:MAG: helix-turn-helix transcriptional regulator [Gammaproteobacteria bacterium]|nr:helix-turn-helix transcriptional regulator [Gammaproteobacteria bacterium]